MQDSEFKQLLIATLSRIESAQDALESKVDQVRLTQVAQGKDIDAIKEDVPEIKEDLRQHKEGNIQNRKRIEHIERLNLDQDALINKSLETYQKEVKPVIDHVIWLQSIPKRISSFVLSASKIVAATVVLIAGIGTLAAYLGGFLSK